MNRAFLVRLAPRLAAAWLVLFLAMFQWSEDFARLLTPFYWAVVTQAEDRFTVATLAPRETKQGKPILYLQLQASFPIDLDARTRIPAGFPLPGAVELGIVTHPVVIILSLASAWPGICWRRRLDTFLIALPGVLAVELATIPFILLGSAEGVMRVYFSQIDWPFSLLRAWFLVLENGGVWALSLIAAAAAIMYGLSSPQSPPGAVSIDDPGHYNPG